MPLVRSSQASTHCQTFCVLNVKVTPPMFSIGGVSPWNARPKQEPSAAYWSPLSDPEPREDREQTHSLSDTEWRYRCH